MNPPALSLDPRPRRQPSALTNLVAARLALFAGLLLLPGAAASQPLEEVSETIDVRLVNIDVVVVDKKGRAVNDLSRDDFQLFEDGKQVPITHFAYTGDETALGDSKSMSRDGSDQVSRMTSADGSGEPMTVVVYLDGYNMFPVNRERVLTDLRQFLQQWSGSAQLVLASYGDRLKILAGPTEDAEVLLSAIPEDRRKESTRGVRSKLDERSTYARIRDSYEACETMQYCEPCIDNWGEMLSYATTHATGEEGRAAVALTGLADLVGAISGLRGEKSVLYVGDGFHQRGGMASYAYLADLCEPLRKNVQSEIFLRILEHDSTTKMHQLTAYANGNRVTLNMLDAAGVHTGMRASVDIASPKFLPTNQNDQIRRDNIQNTHFVLADETGGIALLNASRPAEALQRWSQQQHQGTYSLGFEPGHAPSGRTHRIKVELVGKASKGKRVRFRKSYQDKKLEARLVDQLVSGLYLPAEDGAEQNPLSISASVGEPKKIMKRVYEVPVTVRLDPAHFVGLPAAAPAAEQVADNDTGTASTKRARVWLTAISDKGDRSSVRQRFIDLGAASSDIVVNVSLIPGAYEIGVGVRDEVGQAVSIVRVSVLVADDS